MYSLLDTLSLLRLRPRTGIRFRPPRGGPSVDAALSRYLSGRLGVPTVEFAEPPQLVPAGWEAYIYRFRLRMAPGLPAAFERPMVLRLYAGPPGRPRARREFAAQAHAFRHNYPVPEPLLLEEDSAPLGGPFVVMEQVHGETLLDWLRGNWLRILEVPRLLA